MIQIRLYYSDALEEGKIKAKSYEEAMAIVDSVNLHGALIHYGI